MPQHEDGEFSRRFVELWNSLDHTDFQSYQREPLTLQMLQRMQQLMNEGESYASYFWLTNEEQEVTYGEEEGTTIESLINRAESAQQDDWS